MATDSIRRQYPDRDERFLVAEYVRRAHGIDLARAAFPDVEFG